ncbi:ACP S-malonyltransferase [Dermabacteraceae bacterium TAE3-ERU27]|nr:ACP S-malonyltransferase [Dermabacteraceae bacterium TAE3-ERU27]
MLAIVCPGQGAQKPGFLTAWCELESVSATLSQLSEHAGVNLIEAGTRTEDLRDTRLAQPLLVASAVASMRALGEYMGTGALRADVVSGHSVGEVSASVISGVLTPVSAMRLVRERALAMAAAASSTDTGMAAVVGGDPDQVRSAVAEHGLTLANVNGHGQVVAAGTTERISALKANPPQRARVMPLPVAGAFHSPHMVPARERFARFVNNHAYLDTAVLPAIPHVSNRGGELVRDGAALLSSLVEQVTCPVDWLACMETFSGIGVTGILEVCPAGTLTGMAKRDLPDVARFDLKTPADLAGAAEFVREHASDDAGEVAA